MTEAWNPVSERASSKENAVASRGKARLQLFPPAARQNRPFICVEVGQIEIPQDLKRFPKARYRRRRRRHFDNAKLLLQRADPKRVAALPAHFSQGHAQMTLNSPVNSQPPHPLFDSHVGPGRLPRLLEGQQMDLPGIEMVGLEVELCVGILVK